MDTQNTRPRSAFGRAIDSVPLFVVAAAVLLALLMSFYFVLLLNMGTISDKTRDLKEHPYAVTAATGRMETLLMQADTLDDRLAFTRTPATIESVRDEFAVIDVQFQHELAEVSERYLADPAAPERLAHLYGEFKEEQAALLELSASGASNAEVEAALVGNVDPRIDEMLQVNADIMEGAAGMFDQLYNTAAVTREQTVATATVLMASVIGSLALFLAVLFRKNRQQRELEESLRRALDDAQQANEAKSRFLSSVSHDIRTPLTAIIGLTDIALDRTDQQARVDESLEKIKLSSHHLLNLVNDVLDMSKIESGQTDIERAPFDLRSMMEGLATITAPQAVAKGLDFQVFRCDVGEGAVIGDETRVSQVLINLLGNAVKYTEPGGHVRFGAYEIDKDLASELPAGAPADDDMRLIRFVVEDDGIGMAQDFVSRMFEPFEREDVPARFAVEGTGLGMSIAKDLIDLMGGLILVESARGVGTTLTVDLPFWPCDAPRPAAPESDCLGAFASVSSFGASRPCWEHVRVLLAEDNELVGEISEEFIVSTGATVDRAWDGLEALDLIERAPAGYYDLVFMDVQMPRMDGLQAARAITGACERVGRVRPPIVAMTANAYAEDRTRAYDAGMDDYLVKPIDQGAIARMFERYAKPAPAGGEGIE